MRLAGDLADVFKRRISRLVLVPSDGGKFEVTAGRELIWSKLQTHEFPDSQKLIRTLDGMLPK